MYSSKHRDFIAREFRVEMMKSMPQLIRCIALICFFVMFAWLLLILIFWFPSTMSYTFITNINVVQHQRRLLLPPINETLITNTSNQTDNPFLLPTCVDPSVSVYVYTLPPRFNVDFLDRCRTIATTYTLCPAVANSGLGQPLFDEAPGPTPSWFNTMQFASELIFHARLLNHPCRTFSPERADLFYVPFYGGLYSLSKFNESNSTVRNQLAVDLTEYIQAQPMWKRNNGKDHFMVLGRVAFDYMGIKNFDKANSLLILPAAKNMSVFIIERSQSGENQHGIPYPSYFHPSTSEQMVMWQNKVREMERPHLFSFVGGPRKNKGMRGECIRQCGESTRCKLLNCGGSGGGKKCLQPDGVLKVMTQSVFCLQPPGDTPTRRSTFDSVLMGCIPVFFSQKSAYNQYTWFLPEDASTYSVFIDQKSNASKRIEDQLLRISSNRIERMRQKLIDLIPRLTYAHPNASNLGFEDVVDVALAALARQMNRHV